MNYGSGDLLGLQADQSGLLTLPEVYVTARPSSDGGKEPIGQAEAESIRVGLFKNRSSSPGWIPASNRSTFTATTGTRLSITCRRAWQ